MRVARRKISNVRRRWATISIESGRHSKANGQSERNIKKREKKRVSEKRRKVSEGGAKVLGVKNEACRRWIRDKTNVGHKKRKQSNVH